MSTLNPFSNLNVYLQDLRKIERCSLGSRPLNNTRTQTPPLAQSHQFIYFKSFVMWKNYLQTEITDNAVFDLETNLLKIFAATSQIGIFFLNPFYIEEQTTG